MRLVEAIGAIIANQPDIYGAFARHLFPYMSDPGTREAVLWGLAEIADKRPDTICALCFALYRRPSSSQIQR